MRRRPAPCDAQERMASRREQSAAARAVKVRANAGGWGSLSRSVSPKLRKTCVAAAAVAVVLVPDWILLVVVLVVFLGRVELCRCDDLGDDRLRERLRFLECRPGRFGSAPLRVVVDEDRGSVLRADVAELPVFHGRINRVPEVLQQALVRDALRIELDLYRLSVASKAGGNVVIGRIDRFAAGIARGRGDHAVDLVEVRLDAPETSAGESRLRICRRVALCEYTSADRQAQTQRDQKSQQPERAHVAATNFNATPLLQYRLPVGCGPSSKT